MAMGSALFWGDSFIKGFEDSHNGKPFILGLDSVSEGSDGGIA